MGQNTPAVWTSASTSLPAVNRRERGVAFVALEEEVPTVPLAHLGAVKTAVEVVRGFHRDPEVTGSLAS